MFKGILDKIKSLIPKKEDEGNSKKKIENLVVFLVILIITIIAINVIWSDDKKDTSENNNIVGYKQLANTNTVTELTEVKTNITNNDLEKRLETTLSKIEGVGNVNVLLTYSESSEVIAMYNENTKQSLTEESDESGGNRKIEQTDTTKDIIYEEEDGKKVPITQKIINPKIEGAIIIAEGAKDVNIKANIIQAVEAATGLATHKVQVFEMEN